jgi:radical SAM superfamily enzyme YgiQ (UPF0313 family)
MKVLLIDPPYDVLQGVKPTYNYPLGLAYIAAFLADKGHESHYLTLDYDPHLSPVNPFFYKDVISRYNSYLSETSAGSTHHVWNRSIEAIKRFSPRVVGISTVSAKIKSVLKLASLIKQLDDQITIVLGGHHSQVFAREILKNVKHIDFIVLGEGEETMLELVDELEEKGKNFDHIKGLAFREETGDVVINEHRPLIENLDLLPYPSFCHYYDGNTFVRIHKLAIMASRGCPYNCNYCASDHIWQRNVRVRSPRNVIDEIKTIFSGQPERFLTFYDDCFTLNKKWLLEFCEIIVKEKVPINWQCNTSVNLTDEMIFKSIVEAGCVQIKIAVESGSEKILKQANKNIELDRIREIFGLAKKYKISTTAYVMLGFPTETEYDIRLTQRIIKEIHPDWIYCNVLIPLPGTKYYEWCVEHKIVDPDNAWRGDTMKSIIMNVTGTVPDERFFKLVDETFMLCYKINTNIMNLIKRIPIKHYIKNPLMIFVDVKRVLKYMQKGKGS